MDERKAPHLIGPAWRAARGVAWTIPALALSSGAVADEILQHSGRCQSLTILDRNVAGKCQDRMIEQVGVAGERGFLFRTSDDATVLFVTIDKPAAADGSRTLPVSRIDFALGSQVEPLPVLGGTCVAIDPKATFRAETTCEARTTKGRFAVQFVTIDGAVGIFRAK